MNKKELELILQWFECVQDLSHPGYLKAADYALAKRICEKLGRRGPKSIMKHLPNAQHHAEATKEPIA